MSQNRLAELLEAGWLTASMEAEGEANGQKFREIEFQIYGKMVDQSQLTGAASVEKQEQWSFKIPKTDSNASAAVVRVRSINSGEQYIRTTKTKSPDGGDIEVEAVSSKDEFDQFALFADQGMIKDRYTFPVGKFVYEVDVFANTQGQYFPYVKIDLEIPMFEAEEITREMLLQLIETIELPPLPIELEDITVLPPIGRKAEDEEKVSQYYREYFLVGNKHLVPSAESEPSNMTGEQNQPEQQEAPNQQEGTQEQEQQAAEATA